MVNCSLVIEDPVTLDVWSATISPGAVREKGEQHGGAPPPEQGFSPNLFEPWMLVSEEVYPKPKSVVLNSSGEA